LGQPAIEWRLAASGDIKRGVGQTNELRVALGDGQATLYINDKKFGTLIGNQPDDGGQVGVFAQSGKEPSSSQFSAFGLSKLRPVQNPSVSDPIFEYDFSTAPPEWASWQGVSVKDRELFVKPEAGQGFLCRSRLTRTGEAICASRSGT